MIDRDAIINRPFQAVADLRKELPQIVGAIIVEAASTSAIVDLHLAPPLEFSTHGYPTEPVRIGIFDGPGEPLALPLRSGLTWKHRNPSTNVLWSDSLCLWFPGDPAHRRWEWRLGFEAYVALVHKHLLAEEHCRRGNEWPWEDAPHGVVAASPSGNRTFR